MDKTNIKIKRYKNQKMMCEEDVVVCEHPLTFYINHHEFITLLCTPNNLCELAFGLLYSEGFIHHKDDVLETFLDVKEGICRIMIDKDIDIINRLHGKRVRTTGCGKGTIFYRMIDKLKAKKIKTDYKINKNIIFQMSKTLNQKSHLFLETGGVHASMLVKDNKTIAFSEDVGRHNTIDKVVGQAIIQEIDLKNTALFTTGRISSEMLLKTLKAKIPIIISRSAPTDLAVQLAKEYDVTLIGFARGERMNIYHDVKRVIL